MSEQLYSIKESTLTDIGDALRRRHGETEWVTVDEIVPLVKVNKTDNATGFDINKWTKETNKGTYYNVIAIPNAQNIKVKINVSFPTYGGNSLYVKFLSGFYDMESAANAEGYKYTDRTLTSYEIEFKNTNMITVYYYNAGFSNNLIGYYAEITGYDATGDVVTEIAEVEKEVKKTYKSNEMAQAIDDIEVGEVLPEEAFVLSEDCYYKFYGGGWNWYLDIFKDKITTKDITNAGSMFYNCGKLTNIPMVLKFKNSSDLSLNYVFANCSGLTEVPIINVPNAYSIDMGNMFSSCYRIRDFNGLFENEDEFFESFQNYENPASFGGIAINGILQNCYSIRTLPSWFCKFKLNPNSPSYPYVSYCLYYNMFSGCHCLDEALNIPVWKCKGAMTSDMFNSAFSQAGRLKDITFETNEDGTPIVTEWKAQIIDLTSVGFLNGSSYALNYNSGLTLETQVENDEAYLALKDNPDYWTVTTAYSRYNKTSAMNTINSLPDTSAYLSTAGGTNTIKFKGAAGSKTDGGAINTLTAEEIAIASSKGWTVTFV